MVSPLGCGREAFWHALERGLSGIGPITRFDASTFAVGLAGEVVSWPEVPDDVRALGSHDPKVVFGYAAIDEAMGQAGAILAAKSLTREPQASLIYFMGMDKVKFRKPVTPGDQLIFKMQFLKQRRNVFKMSGTAYVDEKVVAQAELMATFGEEK